MSHAVPAATIHLDHVVTLEEWERDWCGREERYEFVDGQPQMTPQEEARNLWAASRLIVQLNGVLGDAWAGLPAPGVLIQAPPRLTVRAPDLALLRPGSNVDINPLDPASVVLVVEVLSPSTRRVDLGAKRREYASVGIPSYLVADRDTGAPTVTLFAEPVGGDYTREQRGDAITLTIGGHEIPVVAAELFR